MSKKKKLGHNPLAYSMLGHASFDFIRSSEDEEEVKDEQNPESAKAEAESEVPNKVTVSYYLEESLVNKIKLMADKHRTTYSAIISRLLKESLKPKEE